MYKRGNKYSFQIYIDMDMREWLNKISSDEKLSISDVIRQSILYKINLFKKEHDNGPTESNKN